jgi:hypothetical protein
MWVCEESNFVADGVGVFLCEGLYGFSVSMGLQLASYAGRTIWAASRHCMDSGTCTSCTIADVGGKVQGRSCE